MLMPFVPGALMATAALNVPGLGSKAGIHGHLQIARQTSRGWANAKPSVRRYW